MSDLTLTNTRLSEGVWAGVLTSTGSDTPEIEVTCHSEQVESVELQPMDDGDGWTLNIPIPANMISDGVQTFLIIDSAAQETIGSFSLMAGEALGHDIRAEVTLLREELDMLKRAFRRHCLDTM